MSLNAIASPAARDRFILADRSGKTSIARLGAHGHAANKARHDRTASNTATSLRWPSWTVSGWHNALVLCQ
jgi:hypothetical protein